MDYENSGGTVYRTEAVPKRCPFCGSFVEIVHLGRNGLSLDRYHSYEFKCLLRFQVYGIVGNDRRSIITVSYTQNTVRMPKTRIRGYGKWENSGIVTEYELTVMEVCYNTDLGFSTDRYDFGIFE